jgi:hypothetical protein
LDGAPPLRSSAIAGAWGCVHPHAIGSNRTVQIQVGPLRAPMAADSSVVAQDRTLSSRKTDAIRLCHRQPALQLRHGVIGDAPFTCHFNIPHIHCVQLMCIECIIMVKIV